MQLSFVWWQGPQSRDASFPFLCSFTTDPCFLLSRSQPHRPLLSGPDFQLLAVQGAQCRTVSSYTSLQPRSKKTWSISFTRTWLLDLGLCTDCIRYGDERRTDSGGWTNSAIGDGLQNYALETCIILLTMSSSIHLINKTKLQAYMFWYSVNKKRKAMI